MKPILGIPILATGLLLSGLTTVSDADAGFRNIPQVDILPSGSTTLMFGTMNVRYTSDTAQYIGCYEYSYGGGCEAQDLSGTYAGCTFGNNPIFISTVASINSASEIYVDMQGGSCVSIAVDNFSYGLP